MRVCDVNTDDDISDFRLTGTSSRKLCSFVYRYDHVIVFQNNVCTKIFLKLLNY